MPSGAGRTTPRTRRTCTTASSAGRRIVSSTSSFTGAGAATRPTHGLAPPMAMGTRCAAGASRATIRRVFNGSIFSSRTARPIIGSNSRVVSRRTRPGAPEGIKATRTVSATGSVCTSSSPAIRLVITAGPFEASVSPAFMAAISAADVSRATTAVFGTRRRPPTGASASVGGSSGRTVTRTRPIIFLGS